MKLKEGVYQCPCGEIIHQNVIKSVGNGKHKGVFVDIVKCKCGNNVSQKTQSQIDLKLSRGEKV